MNKWNEWLYKYRRLHKLYKSEWSGELLGKEYHFSLVDYNGNRCSVSKPVNDIMKHYAIAGEITIEEHMELACLYESYKILKSDMASRFVKSLPKKEYKLLTRWLYNYD